MHVYVPDALETRVGQLFWNHEVNCRILLVCCGRGYVLYWPYSWMFTDHQPLTHNIHNVIIHVLDNGSVKF